MANTVTTIKAREKFAKAHAGIAPLPPITHVGWGNGGHDPDTRMPIMPTADVNVIPGEIMRKEIKGFEFPIPTTLRVFVDLLFSESGENEISCCGLYDAEGDLVAWKTFKPKPMDEETTLEIDWDEQF
ncbi:MULTISPECIES: hypothetical protein [Anoxybacillus]|uniref:hypothetical protein n=1 Tax=Anoxybacillus TaxID=150247 RepID=UPI0013D38180|nr:MULTISPECIES: hypothetical protein [Anoxybacillus]MED0688042.1 hypothetical protein [Anoxybacillus ayderensis]